MAIKANATKGNTTITGAYLVVWNVTMAKGDKMGFDKNGAPTGIVPAADYYARIRIFDSNKARQTTPGQPVANTAVLIEHTEGSDLVKETYDFITKAGVLDGWTLSDIAAV
jgi:hypothetical protein